MGIEMKNGYMLLFRGTTWDKELSPEQIQDVTTRWMDWFNGLMEDGRAKSGQPLEREGKVVSGKNGTVTDGTFAESKEAIGGYFLLTVDTMEEAIEIAQMCPALEHGIQVEVRPVRATCPLMEDADVEMAEAHG